MALQVGSAYLEVKLNHQKFGSEHGVRWAHIEGNGQREATPPIYANGGTGVVTTGSIMTSRSSQMKTWPVIRGCAKGPVAMMVMRAGCAGPPAEASYGENGA